MFALELLPVRWLKLHFFSKAGGGFARFAWLRKSPATCGISSGAFLILSILGGMMSAITFDTLKFVEKLESAGVNREQAKAEAEALVTALSEAMDSQLATKGDINRLERELVVVKWMVGAVLGLAITSFAKQFL